MSSFILFVLMTTTSPRPMAWTAEFATLKKCEAAGQAITKEFGVNGSTIRFVCAER